MMRPTIVRQSVVLRAKARRFAHQFVRLHGYSRNEFDLLRDIERRIEALKTRSPAEIHSTAVHEAGHAVLGIALNLDFVVISIIPDVRTGTAGEVLCENDSTTADLHMVKRDAFFLRHAMICYAGAEAVRQLVPTDANPDAGASSDKEKAAKVIGHQIAGHAQSMEFLFSLAKRRCALLVAHYQPEIQALAVALEAKLILSGKVARKLLMRSLTKRSGRLMTFEADFTLHGRSGDEAFRSFLRRIKLSDRAH